MKLIVFVYSLNPNSLVFSHQRPMVQRLAGAYPDIAVIAADADLGPPIQGVYATSSEWKEGGGIRNIFKFLRCAIPLFRLRGEKILFSHMTEVQSLIVAPLCRLLGIRHYLWYAHKSRSIYLYLAYPFVTGVITSTLGSCPIKGSKVHPIGQMIDATFLPANPAMPSEGRKKWFHVGRLDPSKKIEEIISSIEYCRGQGFELSLDIFGEPSSDKHYQYAQALKNHYSTSNYKEWLKFKGRLARKDYAAVVTNYDGFVHAFEGSLDKSLVEAVLSKRIVVSLNQEFRKSFQTQGDESTTSASLAQALLDVLKAPCPEIASKIEENYLIALQSHAFEVWIKRLREILEAK